MPERAQHIPPPPPLDEQVDQLLADAAANEDAVRGVGGPADTADVGSDYASPEDLLSDVNASMESLHAQAESAAEAEVEQLAAAVADMAEVERPGRAPVDDPDFASPETIQQLDEKLAASAQELSDRAAEQDRSTEHDGLSAASAASAETEASAEPVDVAAQAADTQADAEVGANVQVAPDAAAADEHAVAPAAVQPMTEPTAGAPAPTPAVEKVIPVGPAASAPGAAPARRYHVGTILGNAAAVFVRPIANYTSSLSPTVRQTIGYAAIITIFQAACLWGFLIFRGPPSEPVPTSEGAVLRHVGDDAEHAARLKAESAHARPAPKASGSDSKAKAAKKDSHGGH